MEDNFIIIGFVGAIFGFVVGIIIGINFFEVPKMSGSYMIYNSKIYKEVPEEELDNIIILEVK